MKGLTQCQAQVKRQQRNIVQYSNKKNQQLWKKWL